ncbi:hypothetical protein ACQ1ZS_14255, partial [Enterococcus faecalis]|uniref:hypothetical protein n=1 Tax=Enterococcus faecalis TaxID=1351 RepID=UPI003D6A9FBA
SLIFIYIFHMLGGYLDLYLSDNFISYIADKNNNINIGEKCYCQCLYQCGQVTITVNHLNKTEAVISNGAGVTAGINAAMYFGVLLLLY